LEVFGDSLSTDLSASRAVASATGGAAFVWPSLIRSEDLARAKAFDKLSLELTGALGDELVSAEASGALTRCSWAERRRASAWFDAFEEDAALSSTRTAVFALGVAAAVVCLTFEEPPPEISITCTSPHSLKSFAALYDYSFDAEPQNLK